MSSCGSCTNRINPKQRVKCKSCSLDYCNSCVGVKDSLLSSYSTGTKIWLCNSCTSKIVVDNVPTKCEHGSDNTENILMLTNLCKKVDQLLAKQDNLEASIKVFQQDMSALKDKVNEHDTDINTNKQKTVTLERDVAALLKENRILKVKLNETEKLINMNCLEITDIPVPRGENLNVTVQLVGAALGFKLDSSLLENCYRRPSSDNKIPPKIILKFIRKSDKDEMLRCRKIKRDFSTRNLDTSLSDLITEHKTIYINELLTVQNKELLVRAKEYKKCNRIKFLWIKNGNILMRKTETSPVIMIKSDSNFNDL